MPGRRDENSGVSSEMTDADRGELAPACRGCTHFHNDPRYLEAAFPGLNTLGSAYGSTRAEDGICELRGIYLSAGQWCERFTPRV
jgi:hypothetical protein